MFFNHRYLINIFIIISFFIAIGCQLQEPRKNHGIAFLKNRSDQLTINKTNKNDVLKIIGQPHSTGINNQDEWVYIERVLTKGKYHKLGKNVLKENNLLLLNFNKYGILKEKRFFDKNDKNFVKFSEDETLNDISQKSFIERFLSSLKAKMYKR